MGTPGYYLVGINENYLHMKSDSKKPCYCWFFRVSELQPLAVPVVLTRFCCNWVRWKADIQSFMKIKFVFFVEKMYFEKIFIKLLISAL